MSKNKFTSNTFTGGLNTDAHPSAQPENTYRYALNVLSQDLGQQSHISNEHSTTECGEIEGTVVGQGYIAERDSTLFFTKEGKLFLVNHETCETTEVADQADFGCTWIADECYNIYPEFKYLTDCNELKVYWSSGCNLYHLNIDEVMDPVRKQSIIDCEDCTYFNLMNCVCISKPIIEVAGGGGGGLPVGAYQVIAQLEDDNGNTTNWFWASEVEYLTSEDNQPGDISKQSISVVLNGLDSSYDRVNIGLVKTEQEQVSVYQVTNLPYNSSEVTYDIQGPLEKFETISTDEVIVKRPTYLRARNLMQKDGRLWIYNTKQENNYNFQKHANKITVGYETYIGDVEDAKKYKSLLRDEVYSVGIQYNYCDGTTSSVHPIPGREGTGGEGEGCLDCSVPGHDSNDAARTNQYCDLSRASLKGEKEEAAKKEDGVFEERVSGPYQGDGEAGTKTVYDTRNDATFQAVQDECGDEVDPGVAANHNNDVNDCVDTHFQGIRTILKTLVPFGDTKDKTFYEALKDYKEFNRTKWVKLRDKYTRAPIDDSIKSLYGDAETRSGGIDSCLPTVKYGPDGCTPIGKKFQVYTEGTLAYWEAKDEVYPETKDCEGNYIYGDLAGQPIRHHKMPTVALEPHFISYNEGVINKYDQANLEWSKGYPVFLGLKFSNIELPNEEDLPKPLCPDNPYTIMYEPRTRTNRSVEAKGIFTGTFAGDYYGTTYRYPKHGLNSFEYVDQNVADENSIDEYGQYGKIGFYETNKYHNFHSPDTSFYQPNLNTHKVKVDLRLMGSGWRYGLYAEGEPTRGLTDRPHHQRGTRQAVNLTRYSTVDEDRCVQGIKYAKGNEVSYVSDGIDTALMNKWRESSVYLQTTEDMPLLEYNGQPSADDASFVGDGVIHESPVHWVSALYGGLKRYQLNQYGAIAGSKYISLDVCPEAEEYTSGTISTGPVGDTWLGVHSFRRTGYVSSKVGDLDDTTVTDPNNPNPEDTGNVLGGLLIKLKELYEDANDSWGAFLYGAITGGKSFILTFFGWGGDCGKVPVSGDGLDPRNFSNLRPGVTTKDIFFNLDTLLPSSGVNSLPAHDKYFPRVQKTLTHYWVESDVNLWNRAVGDCAIDEQETTETKDLLGLLLPNRKVKTFTRIANVANVFYNKLRCLVYDSSFGELWKLSWLNRFYCSMFGLSKLQRWIKVAIRTLLFIALIPIGIFFFVIGHIARIIFFGLEILRYIGAAVIYIADSVLSAVQKFLAKFGIGNGGSGAADFTDILNDMPQALGVAIEEALMNLWKFLFGLMFDVLFTNENLDVYLLDNDACKTDKQGAADIECAVNWEDNYYAYNWDYSAKNEISANIAVTDSSYWCDCSDCEGGEVTNRIYYSEKQEPGVHTDAYTNFKANNYKNLNVGSGALIKLINIGNRLHAHTTDDLFILQYNNVQVPVSDIGMTIIGTGDLLADPQALGAGLKEGYLGIKHYNHSINTPHGYFILDEDARKVYKYTTGGLEEISAKGMYNFFKENIDFCGTKSECHNVHGSGNTGYVLGVDPRLNRFMFTKKDGEYSYTMSYDLQRQAWISYHSYIPDYYIWDRDHMYALKDDKLWRHDHQTNFQTFYGVQYPHIIDFVQKSDQTIWGKEFTHGVLLTEANTSTDGVSLNLFNRDVTWNKIWYRNSYQTTGELIFSPRSTNLKTEENARKKLLERVGELDLVKENEQWRYNELHDYTSDKDSPITSITPCSIEELPINSKACSTSSANYNGRILYDTYSKIKLTFEGSSNYKLYTRAHLTRIQETTEVTE